MHSQWTPGDWAALVTVIGAQIVAIVVAWRTGKKIEDHDARATARAREQGHSPNPVVRPEDRGHV